MKKLVIVLVMVVIPLSVWSQDNVVPSLLSATPNSDSLIPPDQLFRELAIGDTLDRVQRTDSAWVKYKKDYREWNLNRKFHAECQRQYNAQLWNQWLQILEQTEVDNIKNQLRRIEEKLNEIKYSK